MAKMDAKTLELYKALQMIYQHAKKRTEEYQSASFATSGLGWSQEKFEAYYKERAKEASEASKWLFTEIMRISPD